MPGNTGGFAQGVEKHGVLRYTKGLMMKLNVFNVQKTKSSIDYHSVVLLMRGKFRYGKKY